MEQNEIKITHARVHNLKNISLDIPKNKLVVITGPSGSGKSSLAFDTIYVEGQRRYIESLSSYARQFLGQFQPPDVESITGLSPAIAIDQKTSNKNPRSTVGTVTEIYDYMRILFARAGTLYCPDTGIEIKKFTPHQASKEILKYDSGSKIQILAPIKSDKNELEKFLSLGMSRLRCNNEITTIDDIINLKNLSSLKIEVIIDRIVLKTDIEKRVVDSIEQAYLFGDGQAIVLVDTKYELFFSSKNISSKTGKSFPDLEPKLFSFNSPLGACTTCNGLGESKIFSKELMITDENISIIDGAIRPLAKKNSFFYPMLLNVAEQEKVDLSLPLKKLPKKFIDIMFNGSEKQYNFSFKSENSTFEFKKSFNGIFKWLEKKFIESDSEKIKKELETYMDIKECPTCHGLRLNPIALSTRINDKHIMDLCTISIGQLLEYFKSVEFVGEKKIIAEKLLLEIKSRIKFLIDVGLDYLTLNRAAMDLSGGESQRIRLATQIGSGLTGVIYVLDEPSIGLHQCDNERLINTLKKLRDLGNTVLVIEHDEETILNADYVIDLGPLGGVSGGEVIATGTPAKICANNKSITGKFLSKKVTLDRKKNIHPTTGKIKLVGAKENNLKELDVEIPLNQLVCITGVSGSGKSTLVHDVLVPAIKSKISRGNQIIYARNNYQAIVGIDSIRQIIDLDQSPIGRTPHSNPATYTGLFDDIRNLFAQTQESKVRGYRPGRFSFNVKGGRCEECEGNGVKKIEMHFLPDVFVTCNECGGSRYNKETLSVVFKGKSIAQVLDMDVAQACDFFKNQAPIFRVLDTMNSLGLGHIKLGQSATTFSGGEAQRIKLAKELSKRTTGHCLYVLDEPTTGLHFHDIKILLDALHRLVDNGHSMIIIEHNLDVIKTADYIIDLGPRGGDMGGEIVACGSPEEISKNKVSLTGKFLKNIS